MEKVTTRVVDLLPHDPPMVLIDEMICAGELQSQCRVSITSQSLFLEANGVPAFVGIEYMAQAVAAHAGLLAKRRGEAVKVGFLLGTPKLNIHQPYFHLGRSYLVDVSEDWGDDELMRFACRITDELSGTLIQETGLNVFQPKDLGNFLSEPAQGVQS